MPKKYFVAPAQDSCLKISRLLARYLPEVAGQLRNDKGILSEICNLEDGRFHRRIEELRCVGRRLPERRLIQDMLLEKGVEPEQICCELAVNRSTVSRFFQGETSSDLLDRVHNRYHVQLRAFTPLPEGDKFFAGYHYAIQQVREQILTALDGMCKANPPLCFESFCYLWHSLRVEAWRLAMKSNDESSLELAVVNVAQQVRKEPPTCPSCSYRTVQELVDLHHNWGLWFRIVVFCSVDRRQFASLGEQFGDVP